MKRFMRFLAGEAGGGSGGGGTLLSGGSAEGSSQQQAAAPAVGEGAAAPWSWAKEDGAFNEGWLEKLPDNLRGNASLKVIGSVSDLAKSYVETKGLIGKKLEMPGEGATPEAVTAWRKTVGAPDKPEGYNDGKSMRPDTVPEANWDPASEKQFLAIAHKHHLPPGAVKEIMDFYGGSIATGLQASQEAQGAMLQAEGAKLKTTWGADFDANLNTASRVALTVGLDPKTHPIFQSAEVVQAFAKLGKLFSEDKLVKGDSQGINGSIGERIRDITDSKSVSVIAREYRGEFGPERQQAAQTQLHQFMTASQQK